VYMAIFCKHGSNMCQNAVHVTGVQVMQETVDQYEVKVGISRRTVGSNITGDKLAAVTLTGILNVVLIDINAQVLSMSKVLRIGARPTTDIQDPSHAAQVVMSEDRRELLVCKWRLPRPVDPGLLKQSLDYANHRTELPRYKHATRWLIRQNDPRCHDWNINVWSTPSASRD
jgi:hypothetical protein